MASIVDRPGVKPDCCGRRRAVSSGWRLEYKQYIGKHFSRNGKQGNRAVATAVVSRPFAFVQ